MIYAAMTAVIIYYLAFMLYYGKLFSKNKRPATIFTIVTILSIVAAYVALAQLSITSLSIIAITAVLTTGLCLSTSMRLSQAFFGACTAVLSAYCFRGILSSIVHFAFYGGDSNFLSNAYVYYFLTAIALPCALVFFWFIRKKIFTDCRIKRFLSSGRQLVIVNAYQVVAMLNLTIVNMGRKTTMTALWYTEIALGASILTAGMLLVSLYYSLQNSELTEKEINNKIVAEQYRNQLRYYKEYLNYENKFRILRHDFKAMSKTLKTLVRLGEKEKAEQLIGDIDKSITQNSDYFKRYSEHPVLDCMLRDLELSCRESGIELIFKGGAPRGTQLELADAVRIFNNLASNALEACRKLGSAHKKYIIITSTNGQYWSVLKFENTYNEVLVKKNGHYLTTKTQASGHGLGLYSVSEIAAKYGGFLHTETAVTDNGEKLFIASAHIPRQTSTKNLMH